MASLFYKQYQEAVENGEIADTDIMQFLMSLLGQIIFPFYCCPVKITETFIEW